MLEEVRKILLAQVNNTKNDLASARTQVNEKREELEAMEQRIKTNERKLAELELVYGKLMKNEY